MPRSQPEIKAEQVAISKWKELVKCACHPRKVPEGKGYDLECAHKHVEVKGTNESSPGFRYFTSKEFDAARRDPLFEFWLVTGTSSGKIHLYVIPRENIVELSEFELSWFMRLGKKRLAAFQRHEYTETN